MADKKAKDMLSRGVEEWNEWRYHLASLDPAEANSAHAGQRDLDLSNADLHGANLSGADLRDTNLIGANLGGADLTDADFSGANLTDTELSGANLTGALLNNTDLTGANFAGANLIGADVAYAKLAGANLTGASLCGTEFTSVDLSQVKGLEFVEHYGPSFIRFDTLAKSRGLLPSTFFKGCGFSDWQIEHARLHDPELSDDEFGAILDQVNRRRGEQSFNECRVFITYTREDAPFVEALARRFNDKRVRYWHAAFDKESRRLEHQIEQALYSIRNPLVLLVLSTYSVVSDWVDWVTAKVREFERMYRYDDQPRDVLLPVALDEAWKSCDWPQVLRRQIEGCTIVDFSKWEEADEMAQRFAKLYDHVILS